MRGKSQSILIYECFDSDEPSLKEAKLKNQKQYNLALAEFRNKKYARAKELFIECERNCPEDSILFIYINRCKEQLA
jgi:adenylate cyclase